MKAAMRFVFQRVEDVFEYIFSPRWNPFANLGALGWFFYWIAVVSGIYLYIFFDTGVTQAYASLEYLTNEQWYAGGIMRSFHRYASDALVVVIFIHLSREFAMDRLRGNRWFAWFTGVPLLWFIYACGVSGYWMVWDVLSQYIAIGTTEWLDSLPLFAESVASNFLSQATLSGRFFTLMVFIHIAVPLFMLFFMWVHIQRHAQARVNPPVGLAAGTLVALLVLSLAFPAVSQAPADLDKVPGSVNLDWFYLAGYPLLDMIPGGALWLVVLGGTAVLLVLPWVPPLRRPAVAAVDLDNCNGCRRCVDDCPFSAITMQARTDGAPFDAEAVVDANLCMSCGICAGSCPTSTPFRRATSLVPGIQLADYTIAELRERTLAAAQSLEGNQRVMVYACEHGAAAASLADAGVGVVTLPCVGMLPPSFVDFVQSRKLADGVFISGCREGGCYHRLGDQWTRQRVAGERDPYLRKRVDRQRLHLGWTAAGQTRRQRRALERFRRRLAEQSDTPPGGKNDAPG